MRKTNLLLSTLIVSLLFSTSIVTPVLGINGSQQGEAIILETDNIVIQIAGGSNIPFFFFYEPGEKNETEKYKFQLDQVFEIEDSNSNGVYDYGNDSIVAQSIVPLSSLVWEFSDFIQEKDENNVTTAIHFNMTSVEDKSKQVGSPLPSETFYIQFRMHMNIENDTQIKFDVVIVDYVFKSESAKLVMAFRIVAATNRNMVKANNSFSFGNSFFESETTAKDTNGEMKVALSNSFYEDTNRIYVTYDHFDGTMVHDPTLGLSNVDINTEDNSPDTNTDGGDDTTDQSARRDVTIPVLSKGELIFTNAIAILAFLFIPVILYTRRK